MITGIKEGTSAFNSGLATGDVIVMIDELSVVDIHAVRSKHHSLPNCLGSLTCCKR